MGYRSYRSDGAIRIIGPKDRMLAELGALALLGDEFMREALAEFIVADADDGKAVLGLDYEDWKWYESYPDISAFNRIWDHFGEIVDSRGESIFHGSFVRLGENEDDIERHEFGDRVWDLISVSRIIECAHSLDRNDDLRNNRLSAIEQETT